MDDLKEKPENALVEHDCQYREDHERDELIPFGIPAFLKNIRSGQPVIDGDGQHNRDYIRDDVSDGERVDQEVKTQVLERCAEKANQQEPE